MATIIEVKVDIKKAVAGNPEAANIIFRKTIKKLKVSSCARIISERAMKERLFYLRDIHIVKIYRYFCVVEFFIDEACVHIICSNNSNPVIYDFVAQNIAVDATLKLIYNTS